MTPFLLLFKVPESNPMNTDAALSPVPSDLIAASPSALWYGSRFPEFKGRFSL
jgi:hypothetical protein